MSGREKVFQIQTNPDITSNGAIKRWVILSSGRRPVLIRYLFLKFLYDELTQKEYEIFLSFKEVTDSVPIFFALRARTLRIKKRTIRKILENISFKRFKVPTKEEYIGLRQIRYSFEEKTFPPIKKPKPYSGYSKGYKDGKTTSKFKAEEWNSSPLEPSPYFEDEINILLDFAIMVNRNPRILNNNFINFPERYL